MFEILPPPMKDAAPLLTLSNELAGTLLLHSPNLKCQLM